uniref:Odorant receptor n=1 Tax=Timema cristinae TaxID=61476 RepID=A0A7R9CW72_TIMCR|nr:unnamed protein product [Timema cristinae]
MQKFRLHGLVADLWPNIRLMQLTGHWLFEFHQENSLMWTFFRMAYSSMHTLLVLINFIFVFFNLYNQSDDVNDLAANTITVLFFAHCVTKLAYFAMRSQKFYRTLNLWNASNSHPLFAESNARHHAIAVSSMKRLLILIGTGTILSVVAWTTITFFGDSVRTMPDPDDVNETITVEIPRLMVAAWYPWDAMHGLKYVLTFAYQLYWLFITMAHANLLDVLFCCWLIYTCQQLVHLKEIMKPLMEISASLDTLMPHTTELFRAASSSSHAPLLSGSTDGLDLNLRGIYSNTNDFSGFRQQSGALANVQGGGTIGPNGLTKKQEMVVRSAIKYWVERHKHVVRFVSSIGEAYGTALLLHMLTSTVALTLLAYQATKIEAVDVYALTVIGYLFYGLAQIFLFCFYGNKLIEESSSVMEAAYSCHWYDGSEEAKTFVQIVCQQCQKAMTISGAKFFTVSLDLFASKDAEISKLGKVLGAVVTYFMVLVQLN